MKKTMKILLIILVVFLMLIVVGKRILFPPYDEIEVTGKYEINSEDYLVTEDKEDSFLMDGSMREVQVHVWYPKDYDNSDIKLPMVIASHGSCGTIDNNRTLYREFASHGYVVLAVSHPGHAFDTLHSNGKKQTVSMDYLKKMSGMDPQSKPEEAAKLFAEWMELRMTDLTAVMDDSDYEMPVLNVYSDASYSHLHEWKQYRNNMKFLESKNENYENIYYEGTGHMGLCDLSLASPILSGLLDQVKSEVESEEQLKRLNTDCLDFLRRISFSE